MTLETQPEDQTATDAAARRLMAFDTPRGWQFGTLIPALLAAMTLIWFYYALTKIEALGLVTFNSDFRIFWAAARLAIIENPLAVFDVDMIREIHGGTDERWMTWAYPPGFLIMLLPLGALSFPIAWVIFTVVSVLAILAATRPFTSGLVPVWLGFALAPAYAPALFMGQTSLLWTAGLLAALAAMQSDRPVLAGVFIGLLTLKPQLGILIPVALLAIGAWRTIVAATLTTIVVSLCATFVVGVDYWPELRAMAQQHFEVVSASVSQNDLMVSPYGALAGLGVPLSTALALQWFITLLAAATVAIAWRSPRIGFDLKAATLIVAILLSSPYLWYYEAALLAPAALFLLRAGVLNLKMPGILLAAMMWLGLGPSLLFVILRLDTSFRYVFAPLVLLAFITCLWAVYVRLRAPYPAASNLKERP